MTKEKIKRDYDDGRIGYDSAYYNLQRLHGMLPREVDDYLHPRKVQCAMNPQSTVYPEWGSTQQQRQSDNVDGYDRDNTGESPDF